MLFRSSSLLFFLNDTAPPEIYTLSLHDALPIWDVLEPVKPGLPPRFGDDLDLALRSEEHTSELQSRPHLVCRLLLEKKKTGHRAAGAGTIGVKWGVETRSRVRSL